MDVEVTFSDVPAGPLQLRMSRSSPGRYALHEFAKNVLDVRATDASGRPLAVDATRSVRMGRAGARRHGARQLPRLRRSRRRHLSRRRLDARPHQHAGRAHVGARTRGAPGRPSASSGRRHVVARGDAAAARGATSSRIARPNLQYLMDSPTEFSEFALRTFTVVDAGRPGEARRSGSPCITTEPPRSSTPSRADVETDRPRSARNVFGEFPAYEGDTYTFIADYLPWASGDGMEHRNSTILTSPSSLRGNRMDLLDTVAHEFFHAWNVERIRPQVARAVRLRARQHVGRAVAGRGVHQLLRTARPPARGPHHRRATSPPRWARRPSRGGRQARAPVRSAREMSELAPFVDAATSIDRTSFDEHLHLVLHVGQRRSRSALDLTLRDRTDGTRHARPLHARAVAEARRSPAAACRGCRQPVHDGRSEDGAARRCRATRRLRASSSRVRRRARGRRLRAAAVARRYPPASRGGRPGDRRRRSRPGVRRRSRVIGAVPFGSPAYEAGLERDDVLVSLGGTRLTAPADDGRACAGAQTRGRGADDV